MMHGLDEIASAPALAAELTADEKRTQLIKCAAIQTALAASMNELPQEEHAAAGTTDTLSLDEVAKQLTVSRALLIRNRKKYPFVKRVSRKNFVVVESRYRAWFTSRS